MYQELNSYGNSFQHLRALIELGCPNGNAFPTVAPFPARYSFFILQGADPTQDKLYMSDGVGGFNLVSGVAGIQSLLAGNNIVIDNTDPLNPVISAAFNQTGKYLIGGGAAWSGTGFVYNVSQLNYFFNGLKTSAATQVTLAASDPTNNRLDAIVVDENGNVSVIEGTPSANPLTPAIPDAQLLVQYVLVVAATTQPAATQESIYLENTEWATSNYTTSGTQVGSSNFAAADDPKQGAVCIDNSLDGRTGVRFVKSAAINISTFNYFLCWVRFTAAISTTKNLFARFEDATGTLIGSQANLFNYGISRSVLNTWQLAVVPVSAFGAITTVKGLKMILSGGTNGVVVEWDLDNIVLSTGDVAPAKDPVISFYKNGSKIASENKLNLAEGTGMTITAVDDPVTGMITYTLNASGSASPDATPTTKGIVKLAGDLGGTADAPTVPGLANKVDIVAGKQLSTEDYTTAEKTKLAGIAAGAQVNDPNTTLQGNTFNGVSQLVKTDVAGKLPAIDGSQLTNLPAGATNTDALPEGATNLYFTNARAQAAITGTANRISVTAGVIDIAATYVGQTSITTLGTIATGTWQGTAIASGYGGTGFGTYAKGDIIYASAANTLAKLAAAADGTVLTLSGGVPVWAAAGSGLPSMTGNANKVLTTDGTNAMWSASAPGIWSVNGTSLYYSAGNVGIGESSPSTLFVVRKDGITSLGGSGILLTNNTTGSGVGQCSPSLLFGGSRYYAGSTYQSYVMGLGFHGDNYSANISFISSVNGGAFSEVAYIDSGGSLVLTGGLTAGISLISGMSVGWVTNTGYMQLKNGSTGNLMINGALTSCNGTIGNTGSSGTPVISVFSNTPVINNTSGSTVVNGFIFNPTLTSTVNTTINAFQNTVGNNFFGTTSGSTSIGATTTIDASAILQITSTTKGFLPPKMTATQAEAIPAPAEGLMVYATDGSGTTITSKGWWGYNGTTWNKLN